MDVIVKGQPSIEVRMEAKVVDSYKTADAALSESSVNPVQNKVITAELDKKATKAELSALETKVTENKTATDTELSALSAKVDEEVESVQTQFDSHDILIEDLQENKADTTGYYPQLSVGQADNLPDRGDVNEGLLGFRESAGAGNSIEDGVANVQELLGESLVWNQKFAPRKTNIHGIATTYQDGKYHSVGQLTKDYFNLGRFNANELNHKYLFIAAGLSSSFSGKFDLLNRTANTIITNGFAYILYNNTNPALGCYIGFANMTEGDEIDETYTLVQHDLTQMFQAGNEPTTIEEFYARTSQLVGVDFTAYNEGEVLGVNIKGIKSVNDNAWDEEWEMGNYDVNTGEPLAGTTYIRSKSDKPIKVLPNTEYYLHNGSAIGQTDIEYYSIIFFYDIDDNFIKRTTSIANKTFTTPQNCDHIRFYNNRKYGTTYNHDICIRLAHSGYKTDYVAHEESESSFDLTPYFPNGMHGINGVRDSVTKSKATKRFGVVKMKDLTWSYFDAYGFYASVPSDMVVGNLNYLIERPYTKFANPDRVTWQGLDKSVANGIAAIGTSWIRNLVIKDSAYTDAATFKASFTDEDILIYELATPIETEIDPQLNMNYKVWDFGTEELLTDSKSAPVLARTIYGFNATDTIRGNKAKNEEQDVRLGEIERTMVQKEDYAPALTSGFADNLVGSDVIVDKDFTIRKSGDGAILDGAARMEVVKGNSVVWNQLVNLTPKTITSNGVTATIGDDGLVTISGQNNGEANSVLKLMSTTRIKTFRYGHKMLHVASGVPQGADWTKYGLYLTQLKEGPDSLIANGNYKFFTVAGTTDNITTDYVYTIWKGVEHTDCSFKSRLIDLTQMFGAGNEPSTIEEFYARKPIVEDEYAYNEGEVIHCNVDAVKSVGRNVWDEEWEEGRYDLTTGEKSPADGYIRSANLSKCLPGEKYYIKTTKALYILWYDDNQNYISNIWASNSIIQAPSNAASFAFRSVASGDLIPYNHDICINLSDPDFDGKYEPYKEDIKEIPTAIKEAFPEGMMSAGTAHDVAYNDLNKEVGVTEKRIGVVDMGTLNWAYDTTYGSFNLRATISSLGFKGSTDTMLQANIVCSKYTASPYTGTGSTIDKTVKTYMSVQLRVLDSSYTDAASFKEAMQGVMLYYELAEPIVTEHDEPFNLDYQVANGGQEQAIANKKTSAFNAKIAYGFNAAAKIKENANEIAQLKAIITQLQAAIASMVSTTTEEVE